MEPFPGKSKKIGRLAFRITPGTILDIAYHSFWRAIFLIGFALVLILLLTEPPLKYPGIVKVLFLSPILVGYLSFRLSSRLQKHPPVDSSLARRILKEAHYRDLRIIKNNKYLFYAENWRFRFNDYFYVIFDKNATYISSIYNYPSPFAGRSEAAKNRELARLLEKVRDQDKS